jgi:hypothetical protein
MNGGINQLVDTYKGNPQPLQAKVQKAQQGQPPGEIPPDLEEAMALQKIADLRNSAQGQQAMQAGGAQQSVVDKLKQMLGGMQQQARMQGQPVMAARGGSIDQLMSNLGHYYAGGGIVAFDGTKGSEVEDKKAKQREEDRRALLEPLAAVGDIAQLPIAAGYNLAADTGSGLERFLNRIGSALTGKEVNTQSDDQVGNKFRFSPTPFTDMLRKPTEREAAVQQAQAAAQAPNAASIRSQLNAADAARFAEKPAPKPPALPRPPAANVNASAASDKPAMEPTDPMEVALRKSIMDALAKDPEAIRKKAMEQNAQFMGLDALLKPAQDRAAAREARIKEIQGSRQPLWIDALMSAGKPTKGGIAGVLQNMATGTSAVKQNYDAEDLKFLDELNKLNSEIDKAKIEGRYKDVAAGKEAVKDLIAEQRQAEQSGTSLLNKQAQIEATKQIAKDAAAARAQSASQHSQNQALALEERKRQFDENQLRLIRQNDVDRANKIETAISKRTGQIDMQLQGMKLKPEEEAALLARRNAIVKQVMAEYPSVKPAKPSESQFLAAARAANPGVSEAELKAYYKQNYGT